MPNQNKANWQAVLQKVIQPPRERQRLASALGVTAITLSRWAKNDSRPQRSHLARLVNFVQPHYRKELLSALMESYPEMHDILADEENESITPSFFRQVLHDYASVFETLLPRQISSTVIDEAIRLLDPYALGMAITPVLCVPPVLTPNGLAIRSLREQGGRGTSPWTVDLEHKSIFLGMNSLAGYVVQNNRPSSVRDVKEEKYIPVFAFPEGLEVSAAAHPILLEGKTAGCLLAVSTQIEHFTQSRIDMLGKLTNVFALALSPSDFYDHGLVSLRYVPHPNRQQEALKSFRQRVTRLITESASTEHALSNAEAETRAWQELEELLLAIGVEEADLDAGTDKEELA